MAEHYFTGEPTSRHDIQTIRETFAGRELVFQSDAGTFSRGHMDPGSRLLVNNLPPLTGVCADLGCGWGAVGCALAALNPGLRVIMIDINARAVELAARNAQSNGLELASARLGDGLSSVDEQLDAVVTNPPIRAGKKVIYRLFDEAQAKLKRGGRLYLVIRRQQGAPSAKKYLEQRFESVTRLDSDAGYWVLECAKA